MRASWAVAGLALVGGCGFDGRGDPDGGTPDGPVDAGPGDAPSGCPAPFTSSPHGCHAFPSTTLIPDQGWAGARGACQAIGGDLPIIDSPAESAHVASGLVNPSRAWIGLSGTGTDGSTWTWIDGETVAQKGLSLWMANQPSRTGCAMDRPDAIWGARRCTDALVVVCERAPT